MWLNSRWSSPSEPQAAVIDAPEAEPTSEQYTTLAQKLGLPARSAVALDFERFLAEEGIPVYDVDEVHKYLKAKSDKRGVFYGWLPLREQDYNRQSGRLTFAYHGGLLQDGGFVAKVYHKSVPYPVLRTVEKLHDKFGEEVSFFVSDMDKELDPFLLVVAPDGSRWIVERWDEPGFRGAK